MTPSRPLSGHCGISDVTQLIAGDVATVQMLAPIGAPGRRFGRHGLPSKLYGAAALRKFS